MNRHALAFLSALLLFALPLAAADEGRQPEKLTADQLAACEARGGKPEMVLHYVESCVWAARDAGKACRDSDDCEGYCEAPMGTAFGARTAGQCSRLASDRVGGCNNHVEDGRSSGDLCVH